MKHARAILALAVALFATACGQSVTAPAAPMHDGVGLGPGGNRAPAGPSYDAGSHFGGGQYAGTSTTSSTGTSGDSTTVAPGGGDGRGSHFGGGQ